MHHHGDRLERLIAYWLEHNGEHAAEFIQWAGRVADEQPAVAEALRKAAAKLAEADGHLKEAGGLLKGSP